MDMHELTRDLQIQNDAKIVMLVADGLGGLQLEPGGLTELETAKTPNLDALAQRGTSGLSIPVAPGIAPGSGPGHLGLFGYDPVQYLIGRGALEATGIGFKLTDDDVAIRANFCTIDAAGNISDRRAGRISSEEAKPVVDKLKAVKIPGVEIFVEHVQEYRFVIVFRGQGLGGAVADTDPQKTGVPPLSAVAHNDASKKTAEISNEFIKQAKAILKDEKKANCCTLRGFSKRPALPPFQEIYGLKSAAIAVYPMYKGLASLAGMELVGNAHSLQEQVDLLKANWEKYDFFFVHFKYTDSTGEDGNFGNKVKRIEELDAVMPQIMALNPAVLIVTGDHSTPSKLKSHSWHPVPTMLVSDTCRYDNLTGFSEKECLKGGLGQFLAKYLMPMALAHAGRLGKFGA